MAAELKIGIGADNTGLKQGLQDAEKQISAFVNKVGKIGQIGEQLASIGQKMSVGLTLPILALGGSAIKAFADFQKLEMGLAATMKSAGLAKQEMQELEEVAKLPGLGMKEAVKGSIRLQAIGISADKARNIMQQFGNATAAAGGGLPEFERAIYGVQQLANTDFPLGEDLNIIKDALPQVAGLLNDAFGTANTEKIREAGVTSKEVLDVILKGLGELPRVKTGIAGAFENLSDTIAKNLNKVGEVIDKTFDISGIIEKVSDGLNSLVGWFEGLSPAVQKTILVVTGLVAAAGPLLVIVGGFLAALPTMLTGIGAIGAAFTFLTGPIGLVVVGIAAIIAAVVTNWGKIKPYIIDTINYFRNLYNESTIVRIAVAGIATTFKNSFAIVANILKTAWEIFKTFAKGTADLFAGIGTVIKGALTGDLGAIKGGLAQMSSAWSSGIASLSKDLGNGIKGLYNDISKNFADGMAMVRNNQKLQPITDLKIFDKEKIADKVADDITNGVKAGVKKAGDTLKVELPDIEAIGGLQNFNFIDDFGNEVKNAWNLDDAFNGMLESMKANVPKLVDEFAVAQAKIAEHAAYMKETLNNIAYDIENAIGSAIADTVTDMFSSIGEAIGSGGDVMAAMGQSLLQSLGGFLSNMGKMMAQYGGMLIAYGIAEKVLKFSADPFSKIAAGAALLAIGGAMSLVGGAIKGASSGGGGGSVPSGGGNSSQSYSSSFSGGSSGGEGRVVFEISGNNLIGVLDRAKDRNTRLGG